MRAFRILGMVALGMFEDRPEPQRGGRSNNVSLCRVEQAFRPAVQLQEKPALAAEVLSTSVIPTEAARVNEQRRVEGSRKCRGLHAASRSSHQNLCPLRRRQTSSQVKLDPDGRGHFHRFTIQHIRSVLPLLHRMHGGIGQDGLTLYAFYRHVA